MTVRAKWTTIPEEQEKLPAGAGPGCGKERQNVCVLYADIMDEKGGTAARKKYVAVNSDINITTPGMQSLPLSRLNLSRGALLFEVPAGKTFTIRISALDATGTLLEVVSFQYDL